MSKQWHLLSGEEITEGIKQGKFSAQQITEYFLERVQRHNNAVNAYTLVTEERAIKEALAVDNCIANGGDPGPLAGVPYAVKNLFDLEDEVTLAGSKINESYSPASGDATAVKRLKSCGAICLGANNMGEYAYDFVTKNVHHGFTKNPHDITRSAGGSSGGSGACVAAGLSAISLGTDTNGSIRVPSSFCGIWGLKPTYGRLSRSGSFMFAGSLDTIGVFGRSVGDLSLAYDAISGFDASDPVCYQAQPENSYQKLNEANLPKRIARLVGYFERGLSNELQTALKAVTDALNCSENIELPNPELARAAAFIITNSEGAELHIDRLRSRAQDFDPIMRDRFFAGTLNPAAWYIKAQKFRHWWRNEIANVFKTVDVLVAPATPLLAPSLDQESFIFAGKEIALRPNIGLFTQPITLIGLPVVAVPVRIQGSMPTAIQLIGKPYSEVRLLQLARLLEEQGVCEAPIAQSFQ